MNITQAYELIKEADKVGHVVLLEALHGVGKSAICTQYAEDEDLHLEILILSLMDTGDLLGIPETINNNGLMATVWAAPVWYTRIVNAAWPEELQVDELNFVDNELEDIVKSLSTDGYISRSELNKAYCKFYGITTNKLALLKQNKVTYNKSKRSLLFIDEMNRATTDILNAALPLVLDGRLGEHELPIVNGKKTGIVAAINPADTSYTVSSFDPALLDRFVYAPVEPSTTEWLDWARKAGIHQSVIDFILDNPNKLHFIPNDDTEKGASNRSWARLSDYLHTLSEPSEANTQYVIGTLGKVVGAEFVVFLQNYSTIFTMKDVETLVNKTPKTKDVKKLADRLVNEIELMEAIKRIDLAVQLEEKYLDKEDYTKALPYLAYLHALPLESLASYVSKLKEDKSSLQKLALLDQQATSKELFHKIVSYI